MCEWHDRAAEDVRMLITEDDRYGYMVWTQSAYAEIERVKLASPRRSFVYGYLMF